MKMLLLPFYMILEYLLILKLRINCIVNKAPPVKWSAGNKDVYIIVHGLHEKWNFLEYVGNHLNKNGYKILTLPSLGNNTISVNKGVEELKALINKNNIKKFNLLCHSKGGIISKLLLNNPKYANRIGKIINIATPYNGSWLAILMNQTDLLPTSEVISKISLKTTLNKKVLNLYPIFDNHIVPNSSLVLKGAINVQVDVVGHTRILISTKTTNEISR